MTIIKRNGAREQYDRTKLSVAIKSVFKSTNTPIDPETLDNLISDIEQKLFVDSDEEEVSRVQDIIEITLMTNQYFDQSKEYIVFRHKKYELRSARYELLDEIFETEDSDGYSELDKILNNIQRKYEDYKYHLSLLKSKYISFKKDNMTFEDKLSSLTRAASELVTADAPKWEFIAGSILNYSFKYKLDKILDKYKINNLYDKIRFLTDENLYGDYILHKYSKSDIELASTFIKNERDDLLTFSALDLLLKRYVVRTRKGIPMETPQEMFLGISLHLAINEDPSERMYWVQNYYDILSELKVTMATPTMANARKPYHQLSSCFIDTVPDSLNGIYRSIDYFAKVSKFGGGMGMYFGKVRAKNSSIRGFEGASGGVIRWIRLVNDTAVAVDQLGVRTGAVAVYLDVWHRDILDFLSIRTNNGDDRMKAHDVFPGVCYPDMFWKMVKEDIEQDWYLLCPNEVHNIKGYNLEDYYGEEWEKRYIECIHDNRINKKAVKLKDIVRLILKSAVETGTPFAFNRDTVNKYNPNKHCGMIYCSNLCTEIAQNMSQSQTLQTTTTVNSDGDEIITYSIKPGDFVVCNLASLSLGHIDIDNKDELKHIVTTIIRALDSVIDLNYYPLENARITCNKYRAIGLGVSGLHHLLAKKFIKWESEDHLKFVDSLFEDINYYAILGSMQVSKSKGKYPMFDGSDWDTGKYFIQRNYTGDRWDNLYKDISRYGIRNGYIMSIAPTTSTSIISSTTPGIDPTMKRVFLEEKKGYMLTRTAPDLSPDTWWFYKSAHDIDQTWSIKSCGIRQRHIDQAQSMNLYITNKYTMREVLNLYLLAWEVGVKTIYYVRSKSLEIEECESCSS